MTDIGELMVRPGKSARPGDYLWMYLSSAVVLAAGLAIYHFAGAKFGPDGFGEYSLSRRAINFFTPVLIVGMGVAVTRRVAIVESRSGDGSAGPCFWISLLCVAIANAVFSVLANGFSSRLAYVLFGTAELRGLIGPMSIFLWGISLHGVVWAFLRGRFRFRESSLLEMCNVAVIPLVVIVGPAADTAEALMWSGLAMAGLAAGVILYLAFESRPHMPGGRAEFRELLTYGLPRIPGDLALGGFMAFPSLIVAHLYGVELGGYVAFGATLLSLAGAAVAPISTALLPQAAGLLQRGELGRLRRVVMRLALLSSAIAVVGVAAAEIGLEWLVPLYLGADFVGAIPVVRILALSAIPFIVFATLRSVVDAAFHRAINARNICVAVLVFLACAGMFHELRPGINGVLVATLIGHVVLAISTLLAVGRVFKGGGDGFESTAGPVAGSRDRIVEVASVVEREPDHDAELRSSKEE